YCSAKARYVSRRVEFENMVVYDRFQSRERQSACPQKMDRECTRRNEGSCPLQPAVLRGSDAHPNHLATRKLRDQGAHRVLFYLYLEIIAPRTTDLHLSKGGL